MVFLKKVFKLPNSFIVGPNENREWAAIMTIAFLVSFFLYTVIGSVAFADPGGTKIPGADVSNQLVAAGTLLRIIDTGLFKWGARIFAGICIMSSGWALKEQRFGIAIICVIGAIIFGTAPTWVQNIFDIGGGGGVFGSLRPSLHYVLCSVTSLGGALHA
jgi:hypothetical protein